MLSIHAPTPCPTCGTPLRDDCATYHGAPQKASNLLIEEIVAEINDLRDPNGKVDVGTAIEAILALRAA